MTRVFWIDFCLYSFYILNIISLPVLPSVFSVIPMLPNASPFVFRAKNSGFLFLTVPYIILRSLGLYRRSFFVTLTAEGLAFFVASQVVANLYEKMIWPVQSLIRNDKILEDNLRFVISPTPLFRKTHKIYVIYTRACYRIDDFHYSVNTNN